MQQLQIWERATKPWNQEVCEARYCLGERTTLSHLAELSDQKVRQLKEWSRKGNWFEKRKQFQEQVTYKVYQQVINTVSDRISEEFLESNKSHKDGFELLRKLVIRTIGHLAHGNDPKSLDVVKLHRLAQIYEIAVNGERRSLGADNLQNLASAFSMVLREGYGIHEPGALQEVLFEPN